MTECGEENCEPPLISSVWRPTTKWRHLEQEGRCAIRAGLAGPTVAGLEQDGQDLPGAVCAEVGGVCGGAHSQRRRFAPTYLLFVTPVWGCLDAVEVPGHRRESGVNFFATVWRGLLVCVSRVVLVCGRRQHSVRTAIWTLFRPRLCWLSRLGRPCNAWLKTLWRLAIV